MKDNYMGVSSSGELEWFTSWYDPLIDYKANGGPGSGLNVAFLVLPQDREFASFLYETSANASGWSSITKWPLSATGTKRRFGASA